MGCVFAIIDVLSSILCAITLLTVIIGTKKDKLYNIFKEQADIELYKMDVKELISKM